MKFEDSSGGLEEEGLTRKEAAQLLDVCPRKPSIPPPTSSLPP